MEVNVTLPTECVTMDPLHNTPVRLFISDIIQLKPIVGSHSLFTYKSHPINKIEIIGVVTSIKKREDSLKCSVDDGTGSVECFCDLDTSQHFTAVPNKQACASLSKKLNNRLFGSNGTSIKLGDFLHIRGYLKLALKNDTIYVTSICWKVLSRNVMDDVWLHEQSKQIALYNKIYYNEFMLDENLKKVSRAFLVQQTFNQLRKFIQPLIDQFLSESTNINEFFGYELLEKEDIQCAISRCLSSPLHQSAFTSLTKQEKHVVSSNAVASVLYSHVLKGTVIKKKCLQHEVVTNLDQMDSRYYITCRCKQVISAVKEALNNMEKTTLVKDSNSILSAFNNSDFNFIRNSKHGLAIISVILKQVLFETNY